MATLTWPAPAANGGRRSFKANFQRTVPRPIFIGPAHRGPLRSPGRRSLQAREWRRAFLAVAQIARLQPIFRTNGTTGAHDSLMNKVDQERRFKSGIFDSSIGKNAGLTSLDDFKAIEKKRFGNGRKKCPNLSIFVNSPALLAQ